ncbi:MAG: hypothetical protein NZP34_13520, partial [Caldilineales bacterium]|nr:hypothetical protein [Caldilineales bacterium]
RYEHDGILFAAGVVTNETEGRLYRSTDRGHTWQEVLHPDLPGPFDVGGFEQIAVAPAGADGLALTVFAAYNGRFSPTAQAVSAPFGQLYRSTDTGATWDVLLSAGFIGPLAVSPAYPTDGTLFAVVDGALHRSTDAGQTWQNLGFPGPGQPSPIFRLAISPAFAADRTLLAVGYGPTHRSTDAGQTWRPLGGYNPGFGLAMSPAFAADGLFWTSYRLIEGIGDGTPESGILRYTGGGASWALSSVGLPGAYEPFPAMLAVSPAFASDDSLFTALRGQFVGWETHSLFRSYDEGRRWVDLGPAPGNPNVFDLAATRDAIENLVAHLATAAGVWHYGGWCEQRLVNPGFEVDAAWEFPATPRPAGYSLDQAHSGRRSLRAGIVTGPDAYSYSSARQTLTLPGDVQSIRLRVWWYPLSEAGAATLTPPAFLSEETAPQSGEAEAAEDAQYILLLDEQGRIVRTLLWTRSNARRWEELVFDLSDLDGQTLQLHIGVFNNGDGRRTALFADDLALVVCHRRPQVSSYLPVLWRGHRSPRPT